MARIRTIKPEFFTSERVARLSSDAKITFVGIWCQADDYGVARADARIIKGAVWPLADTVTVDDVARHLDELAAHNPDPLIELYVARGVLWLRVVGFAEHQRVNRPSKKRNPRPGDEGGEEASRRPVTPPDDDSVSAHRVSDDTSTTSDVPNGPKPALTSPDSQSVSTHGALTTKRPRNREQGTGNREVEHSSSSTGPYHQDPPQPVDDDDDVARARLAALELGRRDSERAGPTRTAPARHRLACADTRWRVQADELVALARQWPGLDPVALADRADPPSTGLAPPAPPTAPRFVLCADCGLEHTPAPRCPVVAT